MNKHESILRCLSASFVLISMAGLAVAAPVKLPAKTPADYVDPFLGNANSRGQTVVGPTLPHGSVHPSPDTVGGGGSGYKVGQPVRGFSQMHVSGVGWTAYGNLLLSPQTGLDTSNAGHDSPLADEVATAYSYKARLTRYDITAELAPANNAVMYRFSYPQGAPAHLMFDVAHQLPGNMIKPPQGPQGKLIDSDITLSADGRTFSGSSQYSGGFGVRQYRLYYYGQIDKAPAAFGTYKDATPGNLTALKTTAENERIGGWWRFADKTRTAQVKIAVSFHSVERARIHLTKQLPGWDYDRVKAQAKTTWDKALGVIAIDGGSDAQKTQFYTALYHAQIMPRDRTGEHVRFGDAPMWDDHFAVWDTWRTKFPLMVLINPKVARSSIASFSERLRVDGHVRDTFVTGNGSWSTIADQGGNNVDNIIADAYVKGVTGINWTKAYSVLKHNAEHERRGNLTGSREQQANDIDEYRKSGWMASGMMAVSNTVEYAYNDFAASQVAAGLGHTADAKAWQERSRGWRHLFNPEAESEGYKGFIMPRTKDGAWVEDVKMTGYSGSWKPHYYEASPWGYSFFTPHDTPHLITLMGGADTFVKRLDYGLSKRYVDFHNEPAFLAPALFHYAGRPDMSAKWMRHFATTEVDAKGYPGDDDSGAMSSYYVWASLGLFPNAGQDLYFLNGPLFDRIVVNRPEDGKLEITRSGTGNYISAVTLNGKAIDRSWLTHSELRGNARLHFTLSTEPSDWGRKTPPPEVK